MVFNEALTEYLITGLEEALAASEPHPFPEPLSADRYVSMSALQKAIRRGNQPVGLSAALSLLRSNARGFWRRLGVISFEDVGVGNIDLVGWVTVAMGDARLRARLGGDWKVASFLVDALSRSAKDRAVDDLLVMMIHDPALDERKADFADMPFEERLAGAIDCNQSLEAQGLAAWFAMGTRKLSEGLATKINGCPETYFDRLREAGYPGAAVEIGRMAWKRIGDGMPPVFPLLYRVARETEHVVRDDDLTPETLINGVPSCALDKHTRPGLAAYGRYLARSPRMNRLVRQHGEPGQNPKQIVGMLAFRAEGAQEATRLQWEEGKRLRALADVQGIGMAPEAVPEALAILREEIDLVNQCRAQPRAGYL